MTDKTKLLPCPCCEGEAKEMYTYLTSIEWVACLKCGLETKGFGNAEAAAKAWNTRAAPAEDVRAAGEEPVAIVTYRRQWSNSQSEQGVQVQIEPITMAGRLYSELQVGEKLYSRPQRRVPPAIDFNEEILLPCPPGVRAGFCGDVKLSFDGAEYRGRAWLMEQGGKEEWVAIEGPENARKAGEALVAWAEAWEGQDNE